MNVLPSSSTQLRILSEPHETLVDGFSSAVAEVTPEHPVEYLQNHRRQMESRAISNDLAAQYGFAAAMKYQANVKLMSQYHRLPGIPSSFSGLNTLTGNDETIQFEDWLGEPEMSPQYNANVHLTMQHKLGM